jgi:hypothetical protein
MLLTPPTLDKCTTEEEKYIENYSMTKRGGKEKKLTAFMYP